MLVGLLLHTFLTERLKRDPGWNVCHACLLLHVCVSVRALSTIALGTRSELKTSHIKVNRWQTVVMFGFLEILLPLPGIIYWGILKSHNFFNCSFLYSSKIAKLECEGWPRQEWRELIANPQDRIQPSVTAETGNAVYSELRCLCKQTLLKYF